MIVAGIELGGTKSIAVLGSAGKILQLHRVPTSDPGTTLDALRGQLAQWADTHELGAIGIAAFGPVRVDPARPGYGRIGDTPKLGWREADLLAPFRDMGLPIALDTDVTGAALAEGRWGAAQGCTDHVYLTIGTGVGGGVISGGKPIHGLLHPEVGHIRVRRLPDDRFPGICPYHGDCLEGLVTGPALAARAGMAPETLPPDHPLWHAAAQDIAELTAMLLLTLSPQRIVIGGGIGTGQPQLLPLIREATLTRLAGYLDSANLGALDTVIVSAALGEEAGPLGSIALALTAV